MGALVVFPFLFVFAPEVMLQGDSAIRTAYVLGIFAIALAAMEFGQAGWFIKTLRWPERIPMMLVPVVAFIGLYVYRENSQTIDNFILWGSPLIFLVLAIQFTLEARLASKGVQPAPAQSGGGGVSVRIPPTTSVDE